jgi:hypothetical protein
LKLTLSGPSLFCCLQKRERERRKREKKERDKRERREREEREEREERDRIEIQNRDTEEREIQYVDQVFFVV